MRSISHARISQLQVDESEFGSRAVGEYVGSMLHEEFITPQALVSQRLRPLLAECGANAQRLEEAGSSRCYQSITLQVFHGSFRETDYRAA